MTDPAILPLRAAEHWAANNPKAALCDAWNAFRLAPGDRRIKHLLASLCEAVPALVEPEMGPALHQLLRDSEIEPTRLNCAGWSLLRRIDERLEVADIGNDLERLADWLGSDVLALTLLEECPVDDRVVEGTLTRLRRWLAICGRWEKYPILVEALASQTALNGGAWPFDEDERQFLGRTPGTPIARTYVPTGRNANGRMVQPAHEEADRITQAVASQYERWPYPAWRRITRPVPDFLPGVVRDYDVAAADALPVRGEILVAGCGTGRQAAVLAAQYPDARVTAIDISQASLDYATRQCVALGVPPIRFLRLDLHEAATLRDRFDVIFCDGVLHHLSDPEAGWAALEAVLQPAGVMHVALYSRRARMSVQAARVMLGEVVDQPVDDDVLRLARKQLLGHGELKGLRPVVDAQDFSTLVGTHDLIFHLHEDPFDVPRIARAMNRLRLRLLGFHLPTAQAAAQYAVKFPADPLHRDFTCWNRFEFENPNIFARMYEFWCAKTPTR